MKSVLFDWDHYYLMLTDWLDNNNDDDVSVVTGDGSG